MNQPPLNPDALANLRLLADRATEEVRHAVIEPDILHKLLDLAVAQPEVNSVEELDALPIGSIIAPFAYDEPTALLRDLFGTWAVAGLPEPFDTEKIHRALHGKGARVVYIPEVKP